MNYQELLKKYNRLLEDFDHLKKENNRLKIKLGENPHKDNNTEKQSISNNSVTDNSKSIQINNKSDSISKIRLFISLFKGRADVYAARWENKKKSTSGYSPVLLSR